MYHMLYVESKTDDKAGDADEYVSEFPTEEMGEIEMSKENLDLLFEEFCKIDLLDDDAVVFDFPKFRQKAEEQEDYDQEIKLESIQ